MKLTILDGHAVNPGDLSWDVFKKYAEVTVYEQTPEEEVVNRIGNSDAILLNKININSQILEKCRSLKYIGVLATGYNVIDIDSVKKAKICVTNIPSYSTEAVSQHVFALILNFTNSVSLHNESVQNGDWIKNPNFCYWNKSLIELNGKTLGILGYGNIGKNVEKIASAFGMKVIVCPHRPKPEIKNSVSKEELFRQSDFITIHVPLTEETKEIINSSSINMMKDGVYIINTARGGVINEEDVANAVKSKKIAGYAADVILHEPMNKDCPLLNVENIVLTPHIAWAPIETRKRLLNIAENNLKSWINRNPVNTIY